MQATQANRDEVRAWIEKSITPEYLWRMEMPLEQQQAEGAFFPVAEIQVPFAVGMDVYKYAVSYDRQTEDKMRRDISDIIRTPLAKSDYHTYQLRRNGYVKDSPRAQLYAALTSAEYGFIGLTEKEYEALLDSQEKPPRFYLSRGSKVPGIWADMPECISHITYADFCALAQQARNNVKAEIAKKPIPEAWTPVKITVPPPPPATAAAPVAPKAAPAAAPVSQGVDFTDDDAELLLANWVRQVKADATQDPAPDPAPKPTAEAYDAAKRKSPASIKTTRTKPAEPIMTKSKAHRTSHRAQDTTSHVSSLIKRRTGINRILEMLNEVPHMDSASEDEKAQVMALRKQILEDSINTSRGILDGLGVSSNSR